MSAADVSLVLRGKSTATTYSFGSDKDKPLGGWACCTVNDHTGELQITSDWGSWAYRWDMRHLGRPSLTHFIGDRSHDGRHYLADKLTSDDRSKRWVFSPEKTVASLRERILTKRRGLDLGRAQARDLWDALGELEHTDDARDFVSGYYDIDGHEAISRYAIEMDHLVDELTGSYLVLRDAILPVLIAACGATVRERDAAAAGSTMTPEDAREGRAAVGAALANGGGVLGWNGTGRGWIVRGMKFADGLARDVASYVRGMKFADGLARDVASYVTGGQPVTMCGECGTGEAVIGTCRKHPGAYSTFVGYTLDAGATAEGAR